ncbi:MAG: hypothetical protein AB1486_09970 [Planctomycetota bacterium]
MAIDRIERDVQTLLGLGAAGGARREVEPPRSLQAFEELLGSTSTVREGRPAEASSLDGRARATPAGPFILAPVRPGVFANDRGTVRLDLLSPDSFELRVGSGRPDTLTLQGLRAGAQVFLTGAEGPLVRGEVVPLDDNGRITLAGFETFERDETSSAERRRGFVVDREKREFRTADGAIAGRWEGSRRFEAVLHDADGAVVAAARGLYGDGTAVAILPEERVLGMGYDFPRDGEDSGAGPFMWVHGDLPVPPPLREAWEALPAPRPHATAERKRERLDASLEAAGVLPEGSRPLRIRRVAPALDGLLRYLLGKTAVRQSLRTDGRLLDSTA